MSMLAHQQEEYVVCGINGYPLPNGSCTCLPGFVFMDNSRHSKGCYPNPLQQFRCNASGSEMERIEKVNWPEYDYDIFKNVIDTECEQACMKDSLCTVVIYNNDLQQCWKKSMPLPGGRADNSSTAFVKVYKA
ncbi:hypothetical protein SUGI_0716170 [Cryptomeria japonica]|nr:hypothetical protein SUGI_0716170 [Cryptomeria japonica]